MKKKMNFEESMTRLNEIVNELEKNEIPLEEAMEIFKEGMTLAKECSLKLEQFEAQMNSVLEEYETKEEQKHV